MDERCWKQLIADSQDFSVAMRLPGINIIVFDLDDTLCSEKQFVKSGFQAVSSWLKESGVAQRELFPEMWRRFCEGERGTVFDSVLEGAGIVPDDSLIIKAVDVYRTHRPIVSLYPDAEFILNHFNGKKKTGLLSDGHLQSQKNKVKVLGIEHFFDIIVFTDALGRDFWKPHPAGYRRIMDKFGSTGEDCLYVGDNPRKDFYGAQSLGWNTVQIIREDGVYIDEESMVSDYRADISIKDLKQLVSIVV